MPVSRNRIRETLRAFKAYLVSSGNEADLAARLRRAEKRVEEQSRELAELRGRAGIGPPGVRPENVVWIFGTARTGSTWLAFMMEELEDHTVWREPYVGSLFGQFYLSWVGEKHFRTRHLILGERYRESWLKSMRNFVLNEADARFPEASDGGYLVIKEPNGSIGAPLLMDALPESRMIFLIRDPRDVVASTLDAGKKGSWLYERRIEEGGGRTAMFDMQTETLLKTTASRYVRDIGNVKEAYDAHEGPKVLVRYEELRADTPGEMQRIYKELGIEVDDEELERAVQRHAWENVPEERKGEGKFHRKAMPGGWREDLTPEQAKIIEEITAPLLEEFYPDER